MENNKELAQKVVNKYINIIGLYPTLAFLRQIPNINDNSKGTVRFITNDYTTLSSLVNSLEKITGKFVKTNIIKKFLVNLEDQKS